MPKFLIWLSLVLLALTPWAPPVQHTQLAFLAALAGGLLGGIAGAFSDKSETKNESGVRMDPANPLENFAGGLLNANAGALATYADFGANTSDVSSATNSTRSLAQLLEQYSQSGGLPTSGDISSANSIASGLFGARKTALNQSFSDQLMESNRTAAALGRNIDDPILQAKLRTGFMRQSDSLSAEESDFANSFALNLPGRRLGFAQDAANVRNSLADRAMSNRLMLAQLGSSILGGERSFRLQSGTNWSTGTQESGGGIKGAINGVLGGAGAGLSMGTSMAGMGAGAGGLSSQIGSFNLASAMPMPAFGARQPAAAPSMGANTSLGSYGASPYSAPLSSQIASFRY